MDDATKARRPRHLVDWPVILVDVECSLCPRRGRYRLARLAERYGAAVPLLRLLELIAADCTLMKPGVKPRQYEAHYGICYVLPPGQQGLEQVVGPQRFPAREQRARFADQADVAVPLCDRDRDLEGTDPP